MEATRRGWIERRSLSGQQHTWASTNGPSPIFNVRLYSEMLKTMEEDGHLYVTEDDDHFNTTH